MVLEVIKKRQSVRSYQDKEIPEEILRQVLEAGRLAPSASNRQDWKFIVVKDGDLKDKKWFLLVKIKNLWEKPRWL